MEKPLAPQEAAPNAFSIRCCRLQGETGESQERSQQLEDGPPARAQGCTALAELRQASTSSDFHPKAAALLGLIFIYFFVFTKHNLLGPEQLGFSNPEGMSKQQLRREKSLRSNMQMATFFMSLRVFQNHHSQQLNILQKVAKWKITFF